MISQAEALTDEKLLEGAAVLYTIARRMYEKAVEGNELEVVRLNGEFSQRYRMLFNGAPEVEDDGSSSPRLIPRLLDTLRNFSLFPFSDFRNEEDNEDIRKETSRLLEQAKGIQQRIETILKAHECAAQR